MSALKGDFISFSFNGVHSSELGIIRTSDGSRFNENLLPTIQDKTVQVPGGDGTYFFGSYYTQRQFNVPIAFDSLTEEQVRGLYSHFGDKQIHELIFDERPYKYYMAKINGTPQIKTICFEVNGERIYKGEGTLNFICYYPFAKSKFKYLDDFETLKIKIKEEGIEKEYTYKEFYNNLGEWAATSRMKNSKGDYDKVGNNSIVVFNAGDLETDWKIYFNVEAEGRISLRNATKILIFSTLNKQGEDEYVCFNSKTNLAEGYKNIYEYLKTSDEAPDSNKQYYIINNLNEYELIENTIESFEEGREYYERRVTGMIQTGTLYNKFITGGDFFKLPVGESTIDLPNPTKIEYNHLYL